CDLTSVVLYEGVVTTPRNLDQGARCSVTCDLAGGVISRSAVPKERADVDTRSAPCRGGLEPAAGHERQRGGTTPFRRPSSRGTANPDDYRRQDQPVAQHAGPHGGGSGANQIIPIAPGKFLRVLGANLHEGLLHCIFVARAEPGANAIGLHTCHAG